MDAIHRSIVLAPALDSEVKCKEAEKLRLKGKDPIV